MRDESNICSAPDPREQLVVELAEAKRQSLEAQQRLDQFIELAPEAIVMLDVETGRFLAANPRAQSLFGLSQESLRELGPFDLSPPTQPDGTSREFGAKKIAEAMRGGAPIFQWWHSNAHGESFPCEIRLVQIPWGGRDVIRAIIVDISDRKRLQLCERGRSELLEQIALGLSFRDALARLVEITEDILPKTLCSILLLEGERLRLGAAPSLPDFFNQAVDGLAIGPSVGSCGASASTGRRTVISDVMQHENWSEFRALARRAEIRACWSEPIKSFDGETLGTFAMYYCEPCYPAAVELEVIEFAAQLAATVIEHDRHQRLLKKANQRLQQRVEERTAELQQANRELSAANDMLRLASVSFQSYDSIIITNESGTILRVNDSFTRLTGYAAEDVVGKTPRILKSGKHDDAFYSQMWRAIGEQGYWEGDIWNKRKDGTIFPQRLSIRAVKDSSGAVTHFVGDGQDISAQKHASAVESAIEIARGIQRGLFPKRMPQLPGFDIAGAVDAAERVNGDYFDFIPHGEERLFVAVADVCGHGLGPALLTAELHAYIRALLDTNDDPEQVLSKANRLFYRGDAMSFATMFLLRIDAREQTLTYSGAGHRAYVLRADGSIDDLPSTDLPLGIDAEAKMESGGQIQLEQGDIVILATDGIEETTQQDGATWGKQRMFDVIRSRRAEPASDIIQAVFREVAEFTENVPQQDDRTLVIAKTRQAS